MMKTHVTIGLVAGLLFLAGMTTVSGAGRNLPQDVEVPGDHFSLEGALELFKKSKSPEEFERMLNSADQKVNNLDLNGDREIDYIRVIDRNDKNVHAFILQAVVSQTEFQDIAVIELEILGDGKAVLQIVGDADIYGIETIIEPTEEVRVNAGVSTARTYVNVWAWPTVQYVYDPYYLSWESPWSWGYRPYWWRPWRPVAYVVYRPYWEPYYRHYSVCHSRRVVYAHHIYRPVRTTSVTVYNRHHRDIVRARETRGRDSYYEGRHQTDGRGRSYSSGSTDSRSTRSNGRTSASRSSNESPTSGRVRESRSSTAPSYESPAVRERQPRTQSQDFSKTRSTQRSTSWQSSPGSQPDRSPQVQPRFEPRTSSPQREIQSRPREVQTRSSESSRPSVQPRQSGGNESRSTVQRSQPTQQRSHTGGGSSEPAPKKRGRD